jgi:hypothetical protein
MDKQDRIISVTKALKGTPYLNSIGGLLLYCRDYFQASDLQLRFIRMDEIRYPQHTSEHVPINYRCADVQFG